MGLIIAWAFETSFNAAAANEAFEGLNKLGSIGALELVGVTGRKIGELGVACWFERFGDRLCQPSGGDMWESSPAEFVCGEVVNMPLYAGS